MSLYDDMEEVFGATKPKDGVSSLMGTEVAMTNALRNAIKMQYQIQAGEAVGAGLMRRLFPDKGQDRDKELQILEIAERRKRLGLPNDTDDYEELLNRDRTIQDPGRALMWTGMALSRKPLLKFGASPVLKGEKHGGSIISRIFR